MRKIILSILSLCLMSMPAFAHCTLITPGPGEQSTDTMVKKENTSKAKKENSPRSDSEIQKCIMDKFAASEKLKPQGFNTTVTEGEVMLTGNALNAGSKGVATRIAKSCGAKKVTNNIAAPPIPRPKKSEPEKKN